MEAPTLEERQAAGYGARRHRAQARLTRPTVLATAYILGQPPRV